VSGDDVCPVVVLSSGHSLRLRKIKLFEEKAVIEIAELRAQAAKGLGPSALGLGVLGTPSVGFALEAGAMLAVGGLLANMAHKTGLDFLRRAQDRSHALASRGVYFDSTAVKDMHLPRPGAWWAHAITERENSPRKHVHGGDEFIGVSTDVGEMYIRWSEVVGYYPPQSVNPSSPQITQSPTQTSDTMAPWPRDKF